MGIHIAANTICVGVAIDRGIVGCGHEKESGSKRRSDGGVHDVRQTCGNGIQDGTESGVDCGGDCTACPLSIVRRNVRFRERVCHFIRVVRGGGRRVLGR